VVLGHHRITDITVLMGMYTAVSFTLSSTTSLPTQPE